MDPSSKHSLAAFLENHLPPPNFNFVFWNMGLGDRVERDDVYKTPSELGTEWMPGTRCHGYCTVLVVFFLPWLMTSWFGRRGLLVPSLWHGDNVLKRNI